MGSGQNVKTVVFSESSNVAYQIKGNETYDNMQAKTLLLHTPSPLTHTLHPWVGFKG